MSAEQNPLPCPRCGAAHGFQVERVLFYLDDLHIARCSDCGWMPSERRRIEDSISEWNDAITGSTAAQAQIARLEAERDEARATVARMREAMEAVRQKLIRAGAKLPVENKGTIESAMAGGLSIALAVVDGEIDALSATAKPQEGT